MEISSSIIKLNVGGRVFATSKSTLLNFTKEPNFFHSLLEGKLETEKDENGCYFIDRSPEAFAVILNMMRTGILFFETKNLSLREVMIECEFFLITSSFVKAMLPVQEGLFIGKVGGKEGESAQPWILFVETVVDRERVKPIEIFLTGVIDEQVLLRHQASCEDGFLVIKINGRILSMKMDDSSSIRCCYINELSGDRILFRQSDQEREVEEFPLPLVPACLFVFDFV